ncbi:MAG: hypothetical protein FJ215_11715 [Ignavibacteria bacterium]|nr:hypothetical protein [Ignavibacteria bacterium]
MKTRLGNCIPVVILAVVFLMLFPAISASHCDSMNGPVVKTAKAAIEKGDVTLVLKWVKPEHENEVRDAFTRTMRVKKSGGEAKEVADRFFFETVVRLHRMGEGESYTGLKPENAPIEPSIRHADGALESGSVDDLVKHLSAAVTEKLRTRFNMAFEKQKTAERSVADGRKYVEAYVEYIHFVERLHGMLEQTEHHH